MKKVLAFIILVVYFTVSTGFVVVSHFCMDRFDSVQIGTSGSEKCGKCGMHKADGCCRDEVKVVKLENSYLVSKAISPSFSLPIISQLRNEFLVASFYNTTDEDQPVAHGPPLSSDRDVYLQNCVFRL